MELQEDLTKEPRGRMNQFTFSFIQENKRKIKKKLQNTERERIIRKPHRSIVSTNPSTKKTQRQSAMGTYYAPENSFLYCFGRNQKKGALGRRADGESK